MTERVCRNLSFVAHTSNCFQNQNIIGVGLLFSSHTRLSALKTIVILVYYKHLWSHCFMDSLALFDSSLLLFTLCSPHSKTSISSSQKNFHTRFSSKKDRNLVLFVFCYIYFDSKIFITNMKINLKYTYKQTWYWSIKVHLILLETDR